ncbi:MAG: hypothetical protein ACR2H9_10040, partial [Longimicrobiaceae bacterium]
GKRWDAAVTAGEHQGERSLRGREPGFRLSQAAKFMNYRGLALTRPPVELREEKQGDRQGEQE